MIWRPMLRIRREEWRSCQRSFAASRANWKRWGQVPTFTQWLCWQLTFVKMVVGMDQKAVNYRLRVMEEWRR